MWMSAWFPFIKRDVLGSTTTLLPRLDSFLRSVIIMPLSFGFGEIS
jgi:hypothetical protein